MSAPAMTHNQEIADTGVAAEPRKIPVRRLSFDDAIAEMPKYFAQDGDIVTSHFVACLSGLFPEGEDFFVRSVRHFRDQVTDPVLRREVNAFIGQEAVHGREHRSVNDRLAEHGYVAHIIDRRVGKVLRWRSEKVSPQWNLAMTAAIEHFTAVFAEVVLSHPDSHMLGDGVIAEVLLWHAIEESEHKSVAFDVYKTIGGSERLRTAQMNLTTFFFISVLAYSTVRSLLLDTEARSSGKLRPSLATFRKHPMLTREVWRKLRDYNRADFHPDDHDTTLLLNFWREELFGESGRLAHMMSPGLGA